MTVAAPSRSLTVALVGNPNTGKSTLFNALAGVRQHVGNYPGVTVEKKEGRAKIEGRTVTFIDLPGTYSLAPRSLDEMVTVDVLLGRRGDPPPDVVLCIVDASNLERNLYLVSQVLELSRPVVIALNMGDIAKGKGLRLDVDRLRRQLGVPVVEIQAHKKHGIDELKKTLATTAPGQIAPPASPFPAEFQAEIAGLERHVAAKNGSPLPRYLLERLVLDSGGYVEQSGIAGIDEPLLATVRAARERLGAAGYPVPGVEALSRYEWVGHVLEGVVKRPAVRPVTTSDKIDRVLTHWLSGSLFFAFLMVVVFQAIFTLGDFGIGAVETVVDAIKDLVTSGMEDGALKSLVGDGIISGVGSVVVFLPQIFILFFFIAVLEDCGYMARAAYLMDKLMSRVGLSGKSFIPLLSSFACAIPGIMGARVIENRRDRLITILVAPLMTCSARLPVYALLISAFIPDDTYLGGILRLQALVLVGLYFLGIFTAVAVAWLLKRTLLPGPTPPFVMELPSYKMPAAGTVLYRMTERGWEYLRRAGTLIFAVSVLIWAVSYYPRDTEAVEGPYRAQVAALTATLESFDEADKAREPSAANEEARTAVKDELDDVKHEIDGEYLRRSYLGQAGHVIEPVVRPLGWDWRIGCAALASFPAREVVVSTLGVIYNVGDADEESVPLREHLQNATWQGTSKKVFNVPVALSIMVFFALCAQCASTLVIIRRETNSWAWPAFTFAYMTGLAYVGAFLTYQVGMWISSATGAV